jgi:hypothetical protein
MPDSDTSSEINVNLYDNNGKIENKSETKKSSDTDYYFNMLANQNKTVADKVEESSSSDIAHSESSSDSSKKTSSIKKNNSSTDSTDTDSSKKSKKSDSSSKSRNRYETVHFGTVPMTSGTNQSFQNTTNNSQNKAPTKTFNSSAVTSTANVVKQLTPQETRMKKIELLRKLSEIKSKGFSLTKEYDFNSSLEEMLHSELEEKLHGGQKKLDKNHNGRIDSEDFKMLRKGKKSEMGEELGGMEDSHPDFGDINLSKLF